MEKASLTYSQVYLTSASTIKASHVRGFYFYVMFKRYFLVSFLGGLIGAGCVLIVVYVTNTKALVISEHDPDTAVSSLHSQINDFYIFAGIVITLLLVINVGVFVKADAEVDQQIRQLLGNMKKISFS